MANEKNLNPFKKGKSGNPNGRPKKLPELDKLLAEVLGDEKNGITIAQAILKALVAKAMKGDVRAAEVILNRAFGKPTETVIQDLSITNNIEATEFRIIRRRK